MSFREIGVETSDQVCWIRLNRPAQFNALTMTMLEEIEQVIQKVEYDSTVRCLIFTGKGKAFCAGADLAGGGKSSASELDQFLAKASATFSRIAELGKPTIAALNGVAAGGGMELLLACDLIVAAEGVRAGDAHANYGQFPAAGGSVRLPRRVGVEFAKYLMFTGKLVDVREFQKRGMISEVVPPEALISAAAEIAKDICNKSPLGLGLMKRMIDDGLEQSVAAGCRTELRYSERNRQSEDFREGLDAFKAKRKPVFKGH